MKPAASARPSEARAIARAAADWIGVRDGGPTPEQSSALAAWLRADPRHAAEFARLDAASRALDGLSALRLVGEAAADPDFLIGRRAPLRRWRIAALTLATAAALAIAFVGFRSSKAQEIFSATAVTAVGEWKKISLPDGSFLDLNTDSAAAVDYSGSERRVLLQRGEAHFTVAKDAARPFVVQAGEVRVLAVGTAFSVRRREAAVEVLVTEGRVGLREARHDRSLLARAPASPNASADTTEPVLTAGQHVLIPARAEPESPLSAAAQVSRATPAEMARRLAWQERRLEFGPTPLREVVAEFNRYTPDRIVIADAALEELSIGGTFRVGDTATLLRLLELNFSVTAERRGTEILLHRQR